MSRFNLNDLEIDRGWRELRADIDADHAPAEHPTVVFLGAQPAAGKSHAQAEILRWYSRPMFAVDSDELRAQHPLFDEIMATDPRRMPVLTNQAASEWARRSIAHARDRRLDTIVENSFHTPQVITDSAASFSASGFHVHVVALAVPPEVSRLTMVDRYLTSLERGAVPRWTTLAAHDRAVTGAPHTVAALHAGDDTDRITILDRRGSRTYDATTTDPEWHISPASVLEQTRLDHWAPRSREAHARLYLHVAATALRTHSLSETTLPVFAALVDDACRIGGDLVERDAGHQSLVAEVF